MSNSIHQCAVLVLILLSGCAREVDDTLATALDQENLPLAKELIAKGANPNGVIHDGWTPFVIAARNGKIKSVNLLLELSTNPNVPMKDGSTPISWAAYRGHVEIVKSLLAHGADACIRGSDGRDARQAALAMNHTAIATILPSCLQ